MARILVSLALIVCTTGVGACASYDPDLLAAIDRDGDSGLPQAMGGRDGPEPSDASLRDAAEDASAVDDGGADASARDAGGGGDGGDPRNDAGGAGEDAGLGDAGLAGDASVDAGVVDECPSDPNKTTAGTCGCGVAEVCQGLIDTLVHRYGFDGSSTTIADAVGSAHGKASSSLPGTGTLTLAGGAHAVLPAEVVSGYTAATIELWWTWQGGPANQRLISFGTVPPDTPGDSACNGTSTQYHEGSWYRFCTNATRTWEQAWDVCAGAGGYLVAIGSAEEQQYIADHADWGAESIWIGADDRQTEGQWYQPSSDGQQGGGLFWSGDASGSAPAGAYANWLAGEPANTSDKDCAFMQKSTRQWWAWQCLGNGAHSACEWRGHRGTAMDRGVWFSPADGATGRASATRPVRAPPSQWDRAPFRSVRRRMWCSCSTRSAVRLALRRRRAGRLGGLYRSPLRAPRRRQLARPLTPGERPRPRRHADRAAHLLRRADPRANPGQPRGRPGSRLPPVSRD